MKIRRFIKLIIVTATISMLPSVYAREVRTLWFSFQVPDSWATEGNGGDKFFATGAKQAYSPPLVLGEACVASKAKCSSFNLPNPPTEFSKEGCAEAVPQRFTWPGAISETRWVCASVITSGTKSTAGISIFKFNDSVLYVAYLAGEEDTEPSSFLEQLARSLKVNP